MKRIDQKDIMLINLLQKDARTKLRILAAKLELTTSPVHDRILLLLRDGFIRHFRAVVDRSKFGYRYRAFVRVETVTVDFEVAIAALHEVEMAFQLADRTFMLLVNTRDVKAYSKFVVQRLRPMDSAFTTLPISRELKTFARLDFEDIKTGSNRSVGLGYNS